MGVRTVSMDELDEMDTLDIDSNVSLCISDISSVSIKSNKNIFYKQGSDDVSIKRKVGKILKTISKLEKLNKERNEKRIDLLRFMDILKEQQYPSVSMNMFQDFMKLCKMTPKNHYIHYYIYFLHYAEYYHHARALTDVIDSSKKEYHISHVKNIRDHLKYVYTIIKKSKTKETELTT
jgi:hypothetical protein